MSTVVVNYLSTGEVSRQLRVAESKVRHWIVSGQLAGINVAASETQRPKWRISRQALEEFMAKRQATPASKFSRKRGRSRDIALKFF